jgi:hypothetical protein
MKPRHAAALALVGWYLMVPPPEDVPYDRAGANIHGSLRYWTLERSFDSAKECEAGRLQTLDSKIQSAERLSRERRQTKQGHDEYIGRLKILYLSAVCIASDDPRLAK